MSDIIRNLIKESFADLQYGQAAANLRVMRQELIELEVPAIYNKSVRALKKSILSGELDGDRREMWLKYVVGGRLGLITKDESEVSDVTLADGDAVSTS